MPKSRRQRIVNLTQTTKKGREGKEKLYTQLRNAIDNCTYIYLFAVDNMRNNVMKEVREEWKDDRFFLGKNKVMAKALGATQEDEYRGNLRFLAENIIGNVGLLLTHAEPEKVVSFFSDFERDDYARSGHIAAESITIPAGPVLRGTDIMPNNMEPQLRKLGMSTRLNKGVVTLDRDHVLCREGDVLTPEQGNLLKLFFHQLAKFKITIKGHWSNGEYTEIEAVERMEGMDDNDGIDEAMSGDESVKEE